MKSIRTILALALLLCCTVGFAQNRPVRDKIKSLKVAFITERLNLTSKEAQAFWPIYNEHEKVMEDLRVAERTQIRAKLRNLDGVSEAEADKLLEKHLDLEAEKHEEQEKLIRKVKGLLSPKKTFALLKAEEDFKRELIKRYRQNREVGN